MTDKNKEIATIDKLKDISEMGMSGVDPHDIRPPSMLLMQKSSNPADFVTGEGKSPSYGEFFHTGKNKIYKSFECYCLSATKGKWLDKSKDPAEEVEQYRAILAMEDDLTEFGMVFKKSYLYALSSLFTAQHSMKRPMFSIKIRIETKELTNDKKQSWVVPVVRVIGPENDKDKIEALYGMAVFFDKKAGIVEEDVNDRSGVDKLIEEASKNNEEIKDIVVDDVNVEAPF